MPFKVDLLVLGLLNTGPMHGYQLHHTAKTQGIYAWLNVSQSAIYYSLRKLKKQGWVTSKAQRTGNLPERQVYSLTEKGRGQFISLLEKNLASADKPHLSLGLGIYFMNQLPPGRAMALIKRRQTALQKWATQLQGQLTTTKSGAGDPLAVETLQHALKHLELELEWLEHLAQPE
ncbi:MAG: PadR family transcriptional regulator [Chloroflexota bacterium]